MPADPLDPTRQVPEPSTDLSPYPARPRPDDADQTEEERRRAGRGGGAINPANASHSFNIRPDIGEAPGGMVVYTTMKSADYRANPGLEANLAEEKRGIPQERQEQVPEQPAAHGNPARGIQDEFEADLAEAARGTRQEAQEPLPDRAANPDDAPRHPEADFDADLAEAARPTHPEPQRPLPEQAEAHGDVPLPPESDLEADLSSAAARADDVDSPREETNQQANEEGAKRQDEERAASSGEDSPAEPDSSATDSFTSDLRAAEWEPKLEREGEGNESAFRDHSDSGHTPGIGGGHGIF